LGVSCWLLVLLANGAVGAYGWLETEVDDEKIGNS